MFRQREPERLAVLRKEHRFRVEYREEAELKVRNEEARLQTARNKERQALGRLQDEEKKDD